MSVPRVKSFQAAPERLPGNHLLLNILLQSPAAIALLEGPDHKYEFSNPLFDQLVGRNGLQGTSAIDDLLRIGISGAGSVLDHVAQTCRLFEIPELPVSQRDHNEEGIPTRKYFKLQVNAINEPGSRFFRIWIHAADVTELVQTRQRIQESEMRQAVALDAGQIGSFEWNLISKDLVYNARYAEIFGFPGSAVLSHDQLLNSIHPEDRGSRLRAIQEGMKSGNLAYSLRIIRTDGECRWIQVKGRVFFDEEGQPARAYGAVTDITDEKSVASKLEKSVTEKSLILHRQQSELRANYTLFEKMVDGLQEYSIIQLDNVGNIIRWNLGAQKIKGYTATEALGQNFRIFYLPEDRLARLPERLLSRALAEGRAENEGWRIRRDGSRFWAMSVINALHNEDNKVVGFVNIVHDLSEKVAAEEKMKEYSEQLEIRNRELEEFAYIASHDLQEPMRKIQTFIQLIDHDSHNPESTQRYLAKINSAAQRMSTLVRSVLEYSRLANIEELFEQTDLNKVFQLVTNDFELLIKEKNAVVYSDALPLVRAISLQMQQVFSNFISNSLKFCSTRPQIRISSRLMSADEMMKISPLCSSGCWEISFTDNGIGFDEKYAEEIFTMFRRLNSTADYAGTGIGLALCKKIMENHNGLIRAEGNPGAGAQFRVYIPAIRG